jgi:threonyl-tRNA synthetase
MMVHAESFWYEAKIRTPIAVEITESEKARNFEESLVVLYSTETVDDVDPAAVSRQAAEEIRKYLSKIGPKRVVLFPFAFLVGRDEKSSSSTAAGMEEMLAKELGSQDIDVVPFGWYKKFSITSKGHKYSVHSARVVPFQETSEES